MEELIFDFDMKVSAVILAFTFIGIFSEHVHGFHRAKFAMLGAGAMALVGQYYGFYDYHMAIEVIDWNVIFLLGCMMTIVAIMIPTGGFQNLAVVLARASKGRLYLMLALIGTAVTVISLLLDNVTTVVIFGPLIIMIARTLAISPIPYLMAAALLSDTGGVATLVGDPPNLMIGSAADISFNTFIIHMGPPVLIAWIAVLIILKFLFKEELAEEPRAWQEIEEIPVTNKKVWYWSLGILAAMVVLFINHTSLGWEAWVVSAAGLTALMFVSRDIEMDHTLEEVEMSLLLFFTALFMLIGGVEHSQFLQYLGQQILPLVQSDLMLASIVLMWVAAVLSAAIDNIPFTAAMIPIILGLETQGINVSPLWWSLAIGVGMGGNGTHIGSTANVYIVTISERLARETGNPNMAITPVLWMRKGLPAMFITLILSSIFFYLFFDWFTAPVSGV
jgi:Na+/H+ antiporter NhaD/arsenite permease-like protein|tara:strand:- start:55568 stop:56911 length:1344 start_codon:yes stop_codon:yes gene_type:complete